MMLIEIWKVGWQLIQFGTYNLSYRYFFLDILEGDISGIKLNFAKQTKMSFQSCTNTGK